MSSLHSYLHGKYLEDLNERTDLDDLIKKVLPLFIHENDQSQWPYTTARAVAPDKYSYSTNAMILSMLCMANGYTSHNVLFPNIKRGSTLKRLLDKPEYKKILRFIKEGINTLFENIINSKNNNDFLTDSGTYGKNDPLSLLWCYKLAKIFEDNHKALTDKKNNTTRSDINKVKQYIEACARKWLRQIKKEEYTTLLTLKDEKEQFEHSFTLLRVFQLIRTCLPKTEISTTFQFFERRIHQHLAYRSIPDSRYDPAELVFSLEGALLSGGPESISKEAIELIFTELEQIQNSSPYWKPINPLYATRQGEILLPLSVEVGNSLLRICSILDKSPHRHSYFNKHIKLFNRFFRWLKAQSQQTKSKNCNKFVWGWESEHIGKNDVVHLWQSSEIVCFLINYKHLLQSHIGQQALTASALLVDWTTVRSTTTQSPSDYWENGPAADPKTGGWLENEPLLELKKSSKYSIYETIKNHYILPQEKNDLDPLYSILLYGPPGTGKTTVTKEVAKALGWKHITVTLSDFLAGGSAEVEARAKNIFDCLGEQQEAVILFDEIDQFLMDRDATAYSTQSGIFQFMTPGMLPKLNDLRSKKKCIFVLATNYEERIDSAIKREGRIDKKLLLLPPGLKQRERIISTIALAHYRKHKPKCNPTIPFKESCSQLAEKTVLNGYSEIVSILKDILQRTDTVMSEFKKNVEEYKHQFLSIKPSNYDIRLNASDYTQFPYTEYGLLWYMLQQGNTGIGQDVSIDKRREAIAQAVNDEDIVKSNLPK